MVINTISFTEWSWVSQFLLGFLPSHFLEQNYIKNIYELKIISSQQLSLSLILQTVTACAEGCLILYCCGILFVLNIAVVWQPGHNEMVEWSVAQWRIRSICWMYWHRPCRARLSHGLYIFSYHVLPFNEL